MVVGGQHHGAGADKYDIGTATPVEAKSVITKSSFCKQSMLYYAMLQIGRGNRDNLGIIFQLNIFCHQSLEPSH